MLWTIVQSLKKVPCNSLCSTKLWIASFSMVSTGITIHILDSIHYKYNKKNFVVCLG